MADDSILLVGWKDEMELVIGVLPPNSQFNPATYHDGELNILH